MDRSGPLKNVKVLEFAALGPGPFGAMLLSDLGADVLRIDRDGPEPDHSIVLGRGKRSIVLDLKDPNDHAVALALIAKADVLIEGFRPGVMEKLDLGPDEALEQNPRLIYARMTGWGQSGPLANAAGHDINYIALTGALASIGLPEGPPVPPLNLVGDFGGGSLYLVLGIVSALFEREKSGVGQVIDAAMVDGASSLMSIFSGQLAKGLTTMRRGDNILDGSAHFYRTYECSDHRYIALGAMEPQFYALLWEKLGENAPSAIPEQDKSEWQAGSAVLTDIFKRKTRAEWCEILEGTDVCFAPVMEFDEAPTHPHMQARQVYVDAFGILQPGPAPRFSRTPGAIQGAPPAFGEGADEALWEWGVNRKQTDE